MRKFSVIIVAGGNSTRMGEIDKQFILLNGKAVIQRSIEKFTQMSEVCEIIVVTKPENFSRIADMCSHVQKPILFAQGGDSRQNSVKNGLIKISDDADFIAIHDGARPLVSYDTINRTFADAVKFSATTAGVPSKDTIKVIDSDNFIADTPDRSTLYLTQTPQVFEKKLYLSAMNKAVEDGKDYTDDCQLVESIGVKVHMSMGEYKNIKITTTEDIAIANAFIAEESE